MPAPKPISLLQLNSEIKSLIQQGVPKHWVSGEISELTENYSGHCYLELVEKDETSEKIIARCRATIWARNFRLIKPYFESTTGQPFSAGIKVMMKVEVNYHEVFGLSLNILDIEPTYTVGEMVVRKRKIIERLKAEGVYDMNRELLFPTLPARVAVISSKTAAGYEDFVHQLNDNEYGFIFLPVLFPAIMQGADAEGSIIHALESIYDSGEHFDVVVIIRGGGSQAELECFNSYWFGYHIAQYPIPVLTGIGHEQDDSVADEVAFKRLKTPTAVAAFLVDCFLEQAEHLHRLVEDVQVLVREIIETKQEEVWLLAQGISRRTQKLLVSARESMTNTASRLINRSQRMLSRKSVNVDGLKHEITLRVRYGIKQQGINLDHGKDQLKRHWGRIIEQQTTQLNRHQKVLELIDPQKVLERGYSITTVNGAHLQSVEGVMQGDELVTQLSDGKVTSKVQNKHGKERTNL